MHPNNSRLQAVPMEQSSFIWMQRLSRSLSRLETQDIKTQPQINHYLNIGLIWLSLSLVVSGGGQL
jgi:hypothetical protein